jgi:hypothetical protein
MKNLFISIILISSFSIVYAQTNPDSVAYQLQRRKINSMLDDRLQKFGQYDQSLSMHTGIFGFQTKKDIRRSNDILMEIVKTDDEIFRQTKILLDYRAFEQTQVQSHAQEVETDVVGYMAAINKLRAELQRVTEQAKQQEAHQSNIQTLLFILLTLLFLSILFLIGKKRGIKS